MVKTQQPKEIQLDSNRMLWSLSGIPTFGFKKDLIRYTNHRIENENDFRFNKISVDIYKMNSEIYYGASEIEK